jgi:hypothetical protein
MRKSILAAIAALMLAGCVQYDVAGYQQSLPVDMQELTSTLRIIEVGRAEIGPWCFEHKGILSPDGRMCAIDRYDVCTLAFVPGLRGNLKTPLTRYGTAICKGWRPM